MPLIDVKLRGPVLEGKGPGEVERAIRHAINDLVDQGKTKVKAQLYPGHGLITGNYRRSIHGEMQGSMHGRIHDSKVIYGPWLEGVGSRNKMTRFKGYAMFRNAIQMLQRIKASVVSKRIGEAVRKLGG